MGIDAQLKTLSQKLAGAAAPLQVLPKIEKKLNALRLGIELYLDDSPFCVDAETPTSHVNKHGKKVQYCPGWILGYAKLAGAGWRLAVQPVLVRSIKAGDRPEASQLRHGPPRPLDKAPRPVQLASMKLMPKLLEELRKRVRTTIRGIQWARLLPDVVTRAHTRSDR